MEMWWIAQDGSIKGRFWEEGFKFWAPSTQNDPNKQGDPYTLAPPGSAGTGNTGALGLTALSRDAYSMDVFWITPNGDVVGKGWNYDPFTKKGGWTTDHFVASKSAKGPIAAVSRHADNIEIVFVGTDLSIQACYWNKGRPWTDGAGPHLLADKKTVSQFSGIGITSRNRDSFDAFWHPMYGNDVSVFRWSQYANPQFKTFNLHADERPESQLPNGSKITVIVNNSSSMVWWISKGERVWNGIGDDYDWQVPHLPLIATVPKPNSSWTTVISHDSAIKAVYFSHGIWFCWIKTDGAVMGRIFKPTKNYVSEETYQIAPPGSAGRNQLFAISRKPNTIEMFWTGSDNSIWNAKCDVGVS